MSFRKTIFSTLLRGASQPVEYQKLILKTTIIFIKLKTVKENLVVYKEQSVQKTEDFFLSPDVTFL